ncbi:MAG TPA: DUF4349 domain-containing protein [Rhizomicrobium sp.]|jgi:hypothetical protein|nr:DUF4349 domain-containing protein [Rhizomicrobium sp.]
MRKFLILALFPLLLTGCDRAPYGLAANMMLADRAPNIDLFSYSHTLSLAVTHSAVKTHFDNAQTRCVKDAALSCKLISASLSSADDADVYGGGTNATLIVALPHNKVAEFESYILVGGVSVVSRSTSAENVTQEASDADRKIAQLTDYRDRLTELSKRPNLTVDETIRIVGELSKAQSDLDDASSQKRNIKQRVATERLSIFFSEKPGLDGAFSPVGRVWVTGIQLFGQSAANALQFLIQVIPWLPILVAIFFLLRWFWRLARRNSRVSKSADSKLQGGV